MGAAIWRWAVRWLVIRYAKHIGERFLNVFVHDYRLPEFRVQIKDTGVILHGGVEIVEPSLNDLHSNSLRTKTIKAADMKDLAKLGTREFGALHGDHDIYDLG